MQSRLGNMMILCFYYKKKLYTAVEFQYDGRRTLSRRSNVCNLGSVELINHLNATWIVQSQYGRIEEMKAWNVKVVMV